MKLFESIYARSVRVKRTILYQVAEHLGISCGAACTDPYFTHRAAKTGPNERRFVLSKTAVYQNRGYTEDRRKSVEESAA